VIALVFPVPHEPRSVNKMPSSRGGRIGLSKERAKYVTVLDPVLVIGNEVTVTIRPREAP
jgi:hypothetical protein